MSAAGALLVGGSTERASRLASGLSGERLWLRPAHARGEVEGLISLPFQPAEGLRLDGLPLPLDLVAVLSDQTAAGVRPRTLGARLELMREVLLEAFLPVREVLRRQRDWLRLAWIISPTPLNGCGSPERAAAEAAVLGLMRGVTREFATRASTVALVVDGAHDPEAVDRDLAATLQVLRDPGSSFYTGQVLNLTSGTWIAGA
ncbi:MAG TPA: hypothetical protein VFD01_05060 [Candidatus Dormibacteraeota bacterium]|nr:hypothetical protein [Candidatus Dormibacteraeota bacterium]